jgi:hypothetical protein
LSGIGVFEELGSYFKKPLRVNGAYFPHKLLRCLDKLMVNHPLRSLVEKRGARMNEDLLIVTNSLVSFSLVFPASMIKET